MGLINKLKSALRNDKKAVATLPNGQLETPIIVSRDQHNISRRDISPNAIKVLYRLKGAGFQAYLVGGGVRDLLLGVSPKDFDIATDAHPEEVHKLFRNAVMIGRRFRLVHVRFGREIIEVATFRANHTNDVGKHQARQNAGGMLTRDNVYGSIEEDAQRRDFSVNALYYNIDGFTIHDFANGIDDIEARIVRVLGDSQARYREDPVRMLRAIRFAAKLNFDIEQRTAEPILALGYLLTSIPAARMFDEVLKLLLSGYGEATYHLLQEYNLLGYLFPATQQQIVSDRLGAALVEEFILRVLRNSDERIQQGKSVTPAFLFAALLWYPMLECMRKIKGLPPIPAMHQAAQDVVLAQAQHTSIPRRFSTPMKAIWELQWRLFSRHGNRAYLLLDHKRFRAGYDFLLVREASGENLQGLGDWWTRFQFGDADQRTELIKQATRTPANNMWGPRKLSLQPHQRVPNYD